MCLEPAFDRNWEYLLNYILGSNASAAALLSISTRSREHIMSQSSVTMGSAMKQTVVMPSLRIPIIPASRSTARCLETFAWPEPEAAASWMSANRSSMPRNTSPARDLRGWQNLPVSAIAQFEPVVIVDPSTSALEELLRHHPYRLFPVVEEGTLKGTVARSEMESSISQHRPLKLDPAITCRPGDIIREIQSRFIESASGFIVLVEGSDATVLGVVTLHDVLRAQVDLSEREGA